MTAFAIALFLGLVAICCGTAMLAACTKKVKETENSQFTRDDEYDCRSCSNKRTPMCEHCFFFEHPDKTRAKPTYYSRLKEISLDELLHGDLPREEAVERALCKYLSAGVPIPTSLVLEYNKFKEK